MVRLTRQWTPVPLLHTSCVRTKGLIRLTKGTPSFPTILSTKGLWVCVPRTDSDSDLSSFVCETRVIVVGGEGDPSSFGRRLFPYTRLCRHVTVISTYWLAQETVRSRVWFKSGHRPMMTSLHFRCHVGSIEAFVVLSIPSSRLMHLSCVVSILGPSFFGQSRYSFIRQKCLWLKIWVVCIESTYFHLFRKECVYFRLS